MNKLTVVSSPAQIAKSTTEQHRLAGYISFARPDSNRSAAPATSPTAPTSRRTSHRRSYSIYPLLTRAMPLLPILEKSHTCLPSISQNTNDTLGYKLALTSHDYGTTQSTLCRHERTSGRPCASGQATWVAWINGAIS
jgi:hypothetical protein